MCHVKNDKGSRTLRSWTLDAGVQGPGLHREIKIESVMWRKLTGRQCNIDSCDFFSLIGGFTGGLLELISGATTFSLICIVLFNLWQKPRVNHGGIQPCAMKFFILSDKNAEKSTPIWCQKSIFIKTEPFLYLCLVLLQVAICFVPV